jgi:hypothetical protein
MNEAMLSYGIEDENGAFYPEMTIKETREVQPDGQAFIIGKTWDGFFNGRIERPDGTQYAHVDRRFASLVRVYLMVNLEPLR